MADNANSLDLSAIFGELLPELGSFAEIFSELTPLIGPLVEGLELLNPEFLAIAFGLEELAPALESVMQAVEGEFKPVIEDLGELLNDLLIPLIPIVSAALASLEPVLDLLNVLLKGLGEGLKFLLDPIGTVKDALAFVGEKLGAAFAALGSAVKQTAAYLSTATVKAGAALLDLAEKVRANVLTPLVVGIGQAVAEFVRLSLSMSAANQFMALAARGIQTFTATLTAGVGSLVGAVQPFIQALSPGAAFALSYAMRGLTATIGTALLPVANALTAGIHRLSGILLPAMQAIGPALGSLATALMTFVQGTFRSFADTLVTLTPLFDLLAEASHILVSAWDAFRAVILSVIDTLMNWVKSLLGGTGDSKSLLAAFRDGLHRAVEAILKFTVMLARSLGFMDFQARLVKNLTDLAGKRPGEKPSGAAPAATDVGFKGFEDITKTLAMAAFAAAGGGAAAAEGKSEREWLADLAKSLEDIKEGKSLEQRLKEFQAWISQQVDACGGRASQWIAGKVSEWWDLIIDKAKKEVLHGYRTVQAWYLRDVERPIVDAIAKLAKSIPGSSWFS